MRFDLPPLADLPRLPFDTVIDVRSPSEFAEDHLPGAINLPVLSDEERAHLDGGLVEVISKGSKDSVHGVVSSVKRSLERTRPKSGQADG
mgnify:CR=1 FL=1